MEFSDNGLIILAIELLFIWLIKKYRLLGVGICLGIMGIFYALIKWGNFLLNSVLAIFGVMACLGFIIRWQSHFCFLKLYLIGAWWVVLLNIKKKFKKIKKVLKNAWRYIVYKLQYKYKDKEKQKKR